MKIRLTELAVGNRQFLDVIEFTVPIQFLPFFFLTIFSCTFLITLTRWSPKGLFGKWTFTDSNPYSDNILNVKIQCLEGRIDLITELVVGQWSMPVHEPTPTATNNHSNQIVLPPGSVELIITSAPLTTTNNPGAGGWERGCLEQQGICAMQQARHLPLNPFTACS